MPDKIIKLIKVKQRKILVFNIQCRIVLENFNDGDLDDDVERSEEQFDEIMQEKVFARS